MRTFFGIVFALIAIFAGGCGIIFVVAGISESMAGRQTYGIGFMGFLVGVVPGAVAAAVAWALLKKRPLPGGDRPPDEGSDDGEVVG